MKGDRIEYEWDVEELDATDTGSDPDILDHHFQPSLADCLAVAAGMTRARVVLVRDVWEDDGTLADRQWAYLLPDGTLPEMFDGGAKVPARFRK